VQNRSLPHPSVVSSVPRQATFYTRDKGGQP
jgi:hypothetical protein